MTLLALLGLPPVGSPAVPPKKARASSEKGTATQPETAPSSKDKDSNGAMPAADGTPNALPRQLEEIAAAIAGISDQESRLSLNRRFEKLRGAHEAESSIRDPHKLEVLRKAMGDGAARLLQDANHAAAQKAALLTPDGLRGNPKRGPTPRQESVKSSEPFTAGLSRNTAAPDTGDESPIDLMVERKNLQDKLDKGSYVGDEADRARIAEIDVKLTQAMKQKTLKKPPKDPRVAQLAEETRTELGSDLDPDTASLMDRKLNGPMIEEYYEIRRELQDFLDNIDPQNATSKDLGPAVLKAWAKAIYDVGESRRVLANNVVVQYEDSIRAKQKELLDQNKRLSELRGKNERVQEELERIERVQGAVKWAGHLLEANHVLEILGGDIEHVAKLPAVAINTTVALVGAGTVTASSRIEEGIEHLAKYSVQLAAAYEGFASVEALEKAIRQELSNINDRVGEIGWLVRQRDRAQRVYDTAVKEH